MHTHTHYLSLSLLFSPLPGLLRLCFNLGLCIGGDGSLGHPIHFAFQCIHQGLAFFAVLGRRDRRSGSGAAAADLGISAGVLYADSERADVRQANSTRMQSGVSGCRCI